jgi:peptidylprolyl isomerase
VIAAISVGIAAAQDRPTMSGVLEASRESDWRSLDPDNTLYMRLSDGLVVFELAPQFAPAHIENIRKLVSRQYFDGLAIIRSQDNYVAQWGDPKSGSQDARSLGDAAEMLDPEFYRDAGGLAFTALDSRDAYANEVGFSSGFATGRDGEEGRIWLTHCYGALGVGRANSPRSGNGAELYVVTGHAPRHLDRNVTLVGRVVHGIERLSTLPRGTGPLGFYEEESEQVLIESIRFGTGLPEDERLAIELLRTDTETFRLLIEARRYRAEGWFVDPAKRIGLCNVPLPTRPTD